MSDRDWKVIVDNWVNENKDEIIQLLKQMISYKSINHKFLADPLESEVNQLQDFLEDYLKKLDLRTEKWDVYENQPDLVGTLKGKSDDNTLILNGHIDVVPPGNLSDWDYDPWNAEIHEGKLYGRGSCDMKAGVVTNIMAAKFMRDLQIDLESDLQLHIVTDEEGGGGGTKSAIERGYKGNGVIVTEPTDGKINPVEGGLEWVRIVIKGESGHAGWRYAQIYPGEHANGVNVIEKAQKILTAVGELEREWARKKSHELLPHGITTINPGVMLAGAGEKDGLAATTTNPAMIPDYCTIDFDLKYLPTEKSADVRKEFETFIRKVSEADSWLSKNPPQIEWDLHGLHFPPVNTSLDHPLVKSIEKSQEVFNASKAFSGFVAVSDAAYYAGEAIPSVIYGPIGENLHGPNENVDIESVFEVTKVVILSILQWNKIYQ